MYRYVTFIYTDVPVDINECDSNYHECSHMCENLQGGYNCKCRDGYYLEQDGRQCEGTYMNPMYVYVMAS